MKPRFTLSEADAVTRAQRSGLRLIVQTQAASASEALKLAVEGRGFSPRDLWLVRFTNDDWAAIEPITAKEEASRLNGRKPKRTRQTIPLPAAPDEKKPEPRVHRKSWEGFSACTLIRFLASKGESVEFCVQALPRLGLSGMNIATFKIQHRKGRNGEDIPEISPRLCKTLYKAAKGG